jgi:hypothetical protein
MPSRRPELTSGNEHQAGPDPPLGEAGQRPPHRLSEVCQPDHEVAGR